jgi:polyisoprenoid-binding protein YceI
MTLVAQDLPTGTWQVDRVHSTVGFAVRHNAISLFRGAFTDYDASLEVDAGGAATLSGAVRGDSVDVRDENLAAHLGSPEFFDTERFPELLFRSTSVRVEGDELRVEGDLTMKGQTRRVVGRGTVGDVVEDPFGGTRVALRLEAEVDRRDFGISWNMPLPKGGDYLANDVALVLDLELTRA